MGYCDINTNKTLDMLGDILDYVENNKDSLSAKELEEINSVVMSAADGVYDKIGMVHAKAKAYINGRNSRNNLRSSGFPKELRIPFTNVRLKNIVKDGMKFTMTNLGGLSSQLRGIFRRGTYDVGVFLADSGLNEYLTEFSKAEKKRSEFEEKINKKLGRISELRTLTGQQKMGIMAHLIKINPENTENFKERLEQILSAPAKYDAMGGSENMAVADAIREVITQFGLESIETREQFMVEVYENEQFSREREMVDFVMDEFNKIMPDYFNIASMYFNTQLVMQENYTPDTIRSLSGVDVSYGGKKNAQEILDSKLVETGSKVNTSTASAGMKSVQRVIELGKDEVHSFNFIENMMRKYKDAVDDIHLTPSKHLIANYLNNPEIMNTIFSGIEEIRFVKDMVRNVMNNIEGRSIERNESERKVSRIMSSLAEYATVRALADVFQPIKQAIPSMIKTMIVLGSNPRAASTMLKPFLSPQEKNFLDMHSTASKRGISSHIGSLERDISKETSKIGQFFKIPGKSVMALSRKYLDLTLVQPDRWVAQNAWLGYYKEAVKNITGEDVDFANHELNQRAAAYANSQVDIMMNDSLSQTMGKVFSDSGNFTQQLVRRIFLPFASMQQAIRNSNMSAIHGLINSGGDMKDDSFEIVGGKSFKGRAVSTIAANLAEIAIFNGIRLGIGHFMQNIVERHISNLIKLYYRDEEDEILDKLKRSAFTNVVSDLAPVPAIDLAFFYAFNSIVDEDSALMDFMVKNEVFSERQNDLFYESEMGADFGTFGVLKNDITHVIELIGSLIQEDEYFAVGAPSKNRSLSAREKGQLQIILGSMFVNLFLPLASVQTSLERIQRRIKYDDSFSTPENVLTRDSISSDVLKRQDELKN